MKILMITPYLPYPLVSGGQIRSYNLLKNLSKKHQITLAAFIRSDEERKFAQDLKPYCVKTILFKRRKAWSPLNILLAAITPYPFLVSIYFDLKVRARIKKELQENKYDLIHAETFYVMPNIPRTNVGVLLVEQVIEYLVYQRFVESLPAWAIFLKPLLMFDVFKIKWWEGHYWRRAKRLATMSGEDKKFILNFDKDLKVDVVSNGVDIDYFAKTKRKKPKAPTVLFIGNFRWLPNRDAAKFLVLEIWPKIKEKVVGAKLWIVGKNPPVDILRFQTKDIEVDANVDDIREAYGKSDVLVAPIRNGRGTKYKILEAMATKTPIVGTELATEGIDIENGRDALIAQDAQGLASCAVKILENSSVGSKLAESAYALVERKYNWRKISGELDRVYQEVGTG